MFARVLLIVTLCAALPALAMPPIQTWQTTSGAHVYFVETHDLPMLDISIDFPAGSAFDTRAKSGVAGLTQLMLHLGATGLSEDEIAEALGISSRTVRREWRVAKAWLFEELKPVTRLYS